MLPEELQQITDRLEILEGLCTAAQRLPDVFDLVVRTDEARLAPALQDLLGCSEFVAQALLDTQLRRWSPSAVAELQEWTSEVRDRLAEENQH